MQKIINIFLVDDHPLIIEGFKKILGEFSFINIIGVAGTGGETLRMLHEYPSAHVVLLDLNLPDEDGISVCKKLKNEFPGIKIIFLTSIIEGAIVVKALQSGANGFVLKNTELQELIGAINKVMSGETYISREANEAMIVALQSQSHVPVNHISLTRREKEILSLLKKGLTNLEVAKALSLSVHTVDTHRKNMLQKYNVHNLSALLNIFDASELTE